VSDESPTPPEVPTTGVLTPTPQRELAAPSDSSVARVARVSSALTRATRRAAPVARHTLRAVALTLAAEQALRAAGGIALAVVSATRAPQLAAPLAPPPAARPIARRRLRTVVTEVTILERRARR
jgi:hypothetical protein